MGRPAILIPYPFAADKHQERNAQAVADAGGVQRLHQLLELAHLLTA